MSSETRLETMTAQVRVLRHLLDRVDIAVIPDERDRRIAQVVLEVAPEAFQVPETPFGDFPVSLPDPKDRMRLRELAGVRPEATADEGPVTASELCNNDVYPARDGIDEIAKTARRKAARITAFVELLADRGGVCCVDVRKVLDAASDPSSALHDVFEWADERAAYWYRRDQLEAFARREGLLRPPPPDDNIPF